jgi:hypothetical protein
VRVTIGYGLYEVLVLSFVGNNSELLCVVVCRYDYITFLCPDAVPKRDGTFFIWFFRCGGKARGASELSEIKRRLRGLAEDVIAGRVDRGNAAVAGQLLGTYIRAVSTEIKVREVEEFEERIRALEQSKGERWGA